MDASIPQNDRELLLKLNGEIQRLATSINTFSQTLQEIEEKRIGALETRVDKIENIWAQVSGGWKMALVVWTILSVTGFIGLAKWLLT